LDQTIEKERERERERERKRGCCNIYTHTERMKEREREREREREKLEMKLGLRDWAKWRESGVGFENPKCDSERKMEWNWMEILVSLYS